jgi:tRNA C32,U32 (ribose-2'-O)-methylase TrmJ
MSGMFTAAQFERLRVVLVATRNPLNIGAAARAMSNFGFRRLRVVRPFEPAFLEAKSAVGASELLERAEHFDSVADAVGDCGLVVGTTAVRTRNLQHTVRRLEDGARLIRKRMAVDGKKNNVKNPRGNVGVWGAPASKRMGGVALLFGSEKVGLSNEDLSHCHWLMRIPTCDANISMNLGQAVAVCLYELVRDAKMARGAKASEKVELAGAEDLERITVVLMESLRASGYLERRVISDVEERMRRMVRRMGVQARDAEVWLGLLRQIVWKLGKAENSKT